MARSKCSTSLAEGVVTPARSWQLPPANAPRREAEIPSGLATSADGSKLYVCGNLSNRLLELDTETGKTLRNIRRRRRALRRRAGRQEGLRQQLGRPATRAGRPDGTRRSRHRGSRRSRAAHRQRRLGQRDRSGRRAGVRREILTGLHASGLAASPGASVRRLLQRGQRSPERDRHAQRRDRRDDLGQAEPGRPARRLAQCRRVRRRAAARLYVANGSQNAIAVIEFDPAEPRRSKLLGMIPVGWYPGAVLVDDAPRRRSWPPISRACRRRRSHTTKATSRGEGLQLAPVLRFAVARAAAGRRRIAGAFGSRRRQSASAADRRGPAAAAARISRRGPFPSGSASRA